MFVTHQTPAKSRILYVDNDPDLLDVGKIFLERDGTFAVDISSSAHKALTLLDREPYDAIVSDYQMPDMNGIMFLKAVREQGNTTPFILFTSKGQEEVVIEALNGGADFYLIKSGDPVAQYSGLAENIHQAISRKRADETQKKREQVYRDLIENASDAICIVKDGLIKRANARAVEFFGYLEQELLAKPFIEFVHPDDRGVVSDRFRKQTHEKLHPGRFPFRIYKKDKTLRWLELRIAAITEDEIPATLVYLTDITDHKLVVDALRESEERYSQFFKTSLDSVFITTPEGHWIDFNNALVKMFGYDNSVEILRLSVSSFYANPKDRAVFLDLVKRDGFVREKTIQLKKRDGTIIQTLITIVPLKNPDSSVKAFIGTIRDISELERAHEALRESEERFRDLITTTADIIWQTDGQTRFVYVSPQAEEILGYRPDELIEKSPFDHMEPSTVAANKEAFSGAMKDPGSILSFESHWIRKNGSHIVLESRAIPVFGADNTFAGFRGIDRDVTERIRVEDALRGANRKLTLLSSITRHDIKNQLAVMQGYLYLLNDGTKDSSYGTYLEKISDSAQKISAMIQFTKEYETIGVTTPQWQDARSLVNATVNLIQPMQIIVKNDLPSGTEVYADRLIGRVFYNLVDNAVRYGGKITTIRFFIRAGDNHRIIVCEDDGVGIPDRQKERVFERGFGKNTGLGLALSREILSITGITIRENGIPGQGARFEMTLPEGNIRAGTAQTSRQ